MRSVNQIVGGLLLGAIVALTGARAANALAIVDVLTSSGEVSVGDDLVVEIRASLSDPVLGFGLDLAYDTALFTPIGLPEIGSRWIAVAALDGDGLAGLAPVSVVGDDILLATLHFRALAPGVAAFVSSATFGDLAEGFALDPLGFESHVEWGSASVSVVPEPGTATLLALTAAFWLTRRARQPASADR